MSAQLGLFKSCCCSVEPGAKLCPEGKRLLATKNEAHYVVGRLARGETEGDMAAAEHAAWSARRDLLVHVGARPLFAYLEPEPRA